MKRAIAETQEAKLSFSLVLLAIAAFLAPIIGGFLQPEPLPPFSLNASTFLSSLVSLEGAQVAHALLGVLVCTSLIIALLRKQVVQLPQPRIAVLTAVFGLLLALSTGVSSYKMLSLTSLGEWGAYLIGFLATVAVAGRGRGPRVLVGSFVAGCLIVALQGIRQYVTQADPTWRVFSFWQEPNSLAGILAMGFFAAIGLGFVSNRSGKLMCLVAASFIGCAMPLTGSKGGLASALSGFLALFMLVGALSGARAGKRIGFMGLASILAIVLFVGAQKLQQTQVPTSAPAHARTAREGLMLAQAPAPAPTNSLSRVLNSSGTSVQSMKFRENLWQSCGLLIQQNPLGYGLGAFTFYSAKPGLATQTQLAHESYLQLAVEASPLTAVVFVVLLLLCAYEAMRGSRHLPEEQNAFRSAIVAAALASCVHSGVDSDFYQMGIGLSFFILLGVGLQLSSDAVVPEFLPRYTRLCQVAVGLGCAVILVYAAYVQGAIENVLLEFQTSPAEVAADAQSLRSNAGWDPRVWFATFQVAQTPAEQEENLVRSIALGPEERVYRLLARIQMQRGDPSAARMTLDHALRQDPNNLLTLNTLLEMEKKSYPEDAPKIAQRMVAVEKTDYFNIRAIPEIVPTETYGARLYLAQFEKDAAGRIALVRPAIDGYLVYGNLTVPMILKFEPAGIHVYGRAEDAAKNLGQALTADKQLEQDYRTNGDAKGVKWAQDTQRTLQDMLKTVPVAAPSGA